MISTSEVRITCTIAEDAAGDGRRAPSTPPSSSARTAGRAVDAGPPATGAGDRLPRPAGAVRADRARPTTWSAPGSRPGRPEVCLAVADEQTAGRGRAGRTWVAPPGCRAPPLARLPAGLARPGPRLAAGRRPSASPWPTRPRMRRPPRPARSASSGRTTSWSRTTRRTRRGAGAVEGADASGACRRRPAGPQARRRPRRGRRPGDRRPARRRRDRRQRRLGRGPTSRPTLAAAMTSLREASGGRPIDRDALLDGFLARLEARVEALRGRPLRRRRLDGPPARDRPARPPRGPRHGGPRRSWPSAWTR